MKRRFTILTAAFALLTILAPPMGVWGQTRTEVTDVLNQELTGVTGTSYTEWSGKTSNSDAVWAGQSAGGNSSIQLRSSNSNSGIITTTSGGTVTKVVVTWNSNTSDGRTLNIYGKNTAYSAATDLYNTSNQGTLLGTIVKGTSTELTIDGDYTYIGMRSASGAMYITKIDIIWENGAGTTDPSITAENVSITYDAEEGEIEYTVNNPVTGGELTATAEAEWLTVGTADETVPFTCTVNESANARTASITLTYTYNTDQTVTKNVIVTQSGNPNTVDNISDITTAGTYAVQGTIVAKNQRGFIVGDGTGYVYYYNANYDQNAYYIGEIVKLSGPVVAYGGVFEFNSSTTITAATESNYEAENPTPITGAEMDSRVVSTTPAQLSSYVQYEGTLSVSNTYYNITSIEGATTAKGSISYPLDTEFTSLDGKKVLVKGYYVGVSNSQYYNTMIGSIEEVEFTEPTITVANATVEVEAEGAEGTLTVAYENITEVVAEVFFCNAESEETTYDWFTASINEDNNVEYLVEANEGEARTAYMKVYALDDNAEDVYSNLVTINQAAYVAPIADGKYVKVSSTADLTSGQYLIVYEEGSLAFNGSLETLDAVGNTIEVILNNNEIAVTETTTASEFTINTTNGTIKSASGYYIGQTSDANGMASSIETAYTNTITITDGNADIVSSGAYLRYNSASNQTRFRYYKSSSYTGQKAIQLYKKVVEPETYTLDITGYGNSAGGYYLIATPVASVTPSAENGFLTDAYDLYEFDQSADNEWVNYETHFFNLVSGKGYLYANHDNTTLTFTGTPYNGNGEVELVYDENANLKGWNLIGNPFGVTATVDHDYYIMNENGDNFMLTSKETPIDAMQGIFIVTESADDNKAVFTTEEPAAPGEKLVLNVTHNRGVVDRAMIRFGEGQQMPKAMMSPNNTKIYIEQANNDYAVVRSDNESEMPVSFKAAANGTYTLSIDADNVEMDYLHLVDNMTGADVDLLANPSYTFEANTTDNANRFKLVYRNTTNVEENGESFAYFNGDNMVINNEGDAQLQVIDMTGRIVSTETLNGTATVKVNAAPGVYMLRLVNGNDIKTQKVIIK